MRKFGNYHAGYTSRDTIQEISVSLIFDLFLQPSYWFALCSTALVISKWDIHVSIIRFLKFGNCLNVFQFILFSSSHLSSFSGRAVHWAQNGGWLSRFESIMSGKLQPCPQGALDPAPCSFCAFARYRPPRTPGTKNNCGFKWQILQEKTVYAFLRFFYNFNFFLAATL